MPAGAQLVTYARLIGALEAAGAEKLSDDGVVQTWRGIPQQPTLEISFSPTADGYVDVELSSAHASWDAVVRNLGIRLEPEGVIRKHTPSTVGHVAHEPHRPRRQGGDAGRTEIRSEPRPPADEHYVSSEPS